MKLAFPWQRRVSQDVTGEASPPSRRSSPSCLAFTRQAKSRTPSPHRRSPSEEPVQLAPTTGSESFAAVAGSTSSVDESTLRTLLMRQPAAQELGLTDDALMHSFIRSCAVSGKPSPGSPSSVVSSSARYTCAQYLRVVEDLSQYHHNVRGGTLIVGNGRSVLHSNAGGLVDNYGSVVRFNDFQTEGSLARPCRQLSALPPRIISAQLQRAPPFPPRPPSPSRFRLCQARGDEDDTMGAERLGVYKAHQQVPRANSAHSHLYPVQVHGQAILRVAPC